MANWQHITFEIKGTRPLCIKRFSRRRLSDYTERELRQMCPSARGRLAQEPPRLTADDDWHVVEARISGRAVCLAFAQPAYGKEGAP